MLDAIIVGAGFGGMQMLHELRGRGFQVLVLEAGSDVGGAWYWNRYPGARCDVESLAYCYAFSPIIDAEWRWTELYAAQPEIMRYMNYVADKFDLKRDIRFNTRVIAAHWDAPANLWRVETEAGQSYAARYLITAVGCLSTANVPKFPGLESYEGRWVHTGEWPHEGVDFTGLRVGQIGTGSTGIQSIPVIAAQAAALTVFQRTANYSTPARNHPLSPEFQAWVKANYGEIVETMRETRNGHWFRIKDRSIFDVTDEEREAAFEESWEKGGLQFRSEFGDITTSWFCLAASTPPLVPRQDITMAFGDKPH
jgi:cation diffusion facilitator CzcD-associated flavoprotein CzcO